MEKDLINLSLHRICIQEGKSLAEAAQYLKMKYKIDVEIIVLEKRLNTILNNEKAVA
jgi:Zn/Cd-binding protein ZinT